MAEMRAPSRSFANRIRRVLREGLANSGVNATVRTEAVRGTRLRRVLVTANEFEHLEPSERQNLVWRIIGQDFVPEEQLQISMILTLTPQELEGE